MSQTEVQLIKDAVIVNADISNSAAIDVSKISGAMPLAGGTFTDDVTFTGATSVIRFDKSDDALEVQDNMKVTFGNSADLQIFHNGTNSFIKDTGTGALSISGSQVSLDSSDLSEYMVRGIENAQVELYFNGSKKLETVTDGAYVYGNLLFGVGTTGNLQGGDNDKVILGSGNDLQLYHNGTHNYIFSSNGNIELRHSVGGADEPLLKAIPNGAVELYHNSTKRLETTSSGAQITGDFSQLAGSYINGSGGFVKVTHDSGKFTAGASDDLEMFHDGTNSFVTTNTGQIFLRSVNSNAWLRGNESGLLSQDGSEYLIRATTNDSVKLFFNGVQQFETISTGFKSIAAGNRRITIGSTDASGAMLVLDGDSNGDGSGNDYAFIQHNTDGEIQIENYKSAAIRFATGGTDRYKIDASGHLLPAADSTYNIGSNSVRVSNGYFDTLYGDGSNLTGISSGGGFTSYQAFGSSGTWTKPSGINLIRVYVTGGGGGAGGGGAGGGDFGGAGGAGGTAIKLIDVSSVSSVTVTVGGGGSGGAGSGNGNTGGTSSFGSYASATGGGGGIQGNFGANKGGSGGQGSSGDINLTGGDGGAGQDNPGISTQYATAFGVGGASYWGGGGCGSSFNSGPNNGKAYGSGGGAAHSAQFNTGAAGQTGFVYVEQYT